MSEGWTHLQTGFQNEIQTLENSSSKYSQPHARKALCPLGFPVVHPSLPVFPDAEGLTPWEPQWPPNSMFLPICSDGWGLFLSVLPYPLCIALWHGCMCRFSVFCLLSRARLTCHTPHSHKVLVIPQFHHFFCLISLPTGRLWPPALECIWL